MTQSVTIQNKLRIECTPKKIVFTPDEISTLRSLRNLKEFYGHKLDKRVPERKNTWTIDYDLNESLLKKFNSENIITHYSLPSHKDYLTTGFIEIILDDASDLHRFLSVFDKLEYGESALAKDLGKIVLDTTNAWICSGMYKQLLSLGLISREKVFGPLYLYRLNEGAKEKFKKSMGSLVDIFFTHEFRDKHYEKIDGPKEYQLGIYNVESIL